MKEKLESISMSSLRSVLKSRFEAEVQNQLCEVSSLADINARSKLALRDFCHLGLCRKKSWSSWSLVVLDLS